MVPQNLLINEAWMENSEDEVSVGFKNEQIMSHQERYEYIKTRKLLIAPTSKK